MGLWWEAQGAVQKRNGEPDFFRRTSPISPSEFLPFVEWRWCPWRLGRGGSPEAPTRTALAELLIRSHGARPNPDRFCLQQCGRMEEALQTAQVSPKGWCDLQQASTSKKLERRCLG